MKEPPPNYTKIPLPKGRDAEWEVWHSTAVCDPAWDAFLQANPCGQFQQSSGWAEFKAAEGWQHHRVVLTRKGVTAGGFQMLWKKRAGLRVGYVSKGPVAHPETAETMQILAELLTAATRRLGLIALIIQPPDETATEPVCFHEIGFVTSNPMRIVEATWLIDLGSDIETLRGRMSSGRRKNLRKAKSLASRIVEGDRRNLGTFFALMTVTCQRQGVTPNPSSEGAFHRLWDIFSRNKSMRLTLAECNGANCAGLVSIGFGDRLTFWKKGWNGQYDHHRLSELLEDESLEWANRHGFRLFDFCSFGRDSARQILQGKPAHTLKLSTRDEYHSRYGGRPQLLPQAMIFLPSPLIRWFYRQTYVRREHRRQIPQKA